MQLHVSLRGRQREIWQTEEGKAVWPWGQNRVMCHEPRNGQPPEAGRGREKILLWSLWRECCPPDALISAQRYRLQTSGLPNCEGINFCFKRPGLWKFLEQPQETDTVSYYPSSTLEISRTVHTKEHLDSSEVPERLKQYFKAKQRHNHPKIQSNLKQVQYYITNLH